ncbi:hypothetical protein LG293_16095 (plasmid) [Citricoccus nitrophenolicus]
MNSSAQVTEPTAETLARLVRAESTTTDGGCAALLDATNAQCQRDIADRMLCARHHKVAHARYEKAAAGQRRIMSRDVTQQVTVTVGDLTDALDGQHRRGVTVRLRSASIADFELCSIDRADDGRVRLSIGHCLNNSRYSGGVYGLLDPGHLVDVGTTAWAPAGLTESLSAKAVQVRSWKDMRLSDLQGAA